MNESNHFARRYHWLSEKVTDFVNEPHSAILAEAFGPALNLVATESMPARQTIAGISREEKPEQVITDLRKIQILEMPERHFLTNRDLHPDSLSKIVLSTYERQPQDFEQLLGLPGVGPKTIRALALISELIYGFTPSYRDPARYTFAHGGKDGIPYPVDRKTYDQSIELMHRAINKARLGLMEKKEAFNRLEKIHEPK
jgi:hypothetical protein